MRTKTPPETWRECRGCKVKLELTLANFGLHRTGANGWMPRCRGCMSALKRAWSKKHRDELAKARLEAAPPLKAGQICPECCDLSHRRPRFGCPRCRAPYESLPPIELVTRRSFERAV